MPVSRWVARRQQQLDLLAPARLAAQIPAGLVDREQTAVGVLKRLALGVEPPHDLHNRS